MGSRVRRGLVSAGVATLAAIALAIGATGATSVTVATAHNGALGPILVSSSGLTLYHYLGDKGKKITCTGACATEWPPLLVTAKAKPLAGKGVKASKLGELKRPDGTLQVTYDGLPLYRFLADKKKGDVKGQAVESAWYVVAPSGAIVKTSTDGSVSSSAGSATTPSSSSAGPYG